MINVNDTRDDQSTVSKNECSVITRQQNSDHVKSSHIITSHIQLSSIVMSHTMNLTVMHNSSSNIHISVHYDAVRVRILYRPPFINTRNRVIKTTKLPLLDLTFYDVVNVMFSRMQSNDVVFLVNNDCKKSIVVAQFVADAMLIPGLKIKVSCVGAATTVEMAKMIHARIKGEPRSIESKSGVEHQSITYQHTDVFNMSRVDVTPDASWDFAYNSMYMWHSVHQQASIPCYAWL